MILYPDQATFVEKVRSKIIEGHKSIICQSPTGSGKTVMFSYISKNAIEKGGKVLIVTDRIELLTETGGTLNDFGIDFFAIKAGQMSPPPNYYSCYVAMAQTLKRRIKTWGKWFDQFTIVIFDEAHKQEFNDFFVEVVFPSALKLGFTATPKRAGKQRQLGEDYSTIVEGLTVNELIALGRLVPDKYYTVKAPDQTTYKLNRKGDDFDDAAVFQSFDKPELYDGVIEAYQQHAMGLSNLVFCVNIQHCIETAKRFNDAGIKAKFLTSAVAKPKLADNPTEGQIARYNKHFEEWEKWVDGYALYSGNRDEVLSEWKNGEFKVLINAGILTTGFNWKPLQCVQVFRATLSDNLWLQMIGRGSRPSEGKDHFVILDHGRHGERLGRYRDRREYSLIHEESKGGGAPPVKECGSSGNPDKDNRPGCGSYIATSIMICPFCGYTYPTEKELIVAELALLEYDILPTNESVKPVSYFKQLELEQESKGYKVGWIYQRIFREQGQQGLVDYAKEKGFNNGWVWNTMKRMRLK